MFELLEVRKIEEKIFELIFKNERREISFLVRIIPHKVKSIEEPMDFIVPEENAQEFSDIWGQSLELRQKVGKKIREMKNLPISELQEV